MQTVGECGNPTLGVITRVILFNHMEFIFELVNPKLITNNNLSSEILTYISNFLFTKST